MGVVRDIQILAGGMINQTQAVNGEWVIRFDTFELAEPHRYYGEQMVYERLAAVGVPVPRVLLVDTSKAIVPFNYMVMSRIEGETLAVAWPNLTRSQQIKIAYAAGQILARMHSVTFEKVGWVRLFPDGKSPTWFEVIEDYFERFAQFALEAALIEPALYERIRGSMEQFRPSLEAIQTGHLLHSDFHLGNILQKDGIITGIIDFEWALSGDPTYDLVVVSEWEASEPGSVADVYRGYRSLRPFAPHHAKMSTFYKMMMLIDSIMLSKKDYEWSRRLASKLEETVVEVEELLGRDIRQV